MPKLLKKIIFTLLPVVATAIAFELFARTIPTSYGAKHSNLLHKKDRIEVLVLGSSHANFGINPRYFGREAYNISNTSQGLYQDYNLLLRYLPECRKVKMVIVPISYFSLLSDSASGPENWRGNYYSVYMGVKGNESSSGFDLKDHSALFLWDGPIGVIENARNINKVNINEYGYQVPTKAHATSEINDDCGKSRVCFHDNIMHYNLLSSNIVLLQKIADLLHTKNIKLVFITTPVYKTYYSHISNKRYKTMTDTINNLSKQNSAQYFNYFYDKRFGMADFLDNDHLNESGAKKFSIILKNDVIDKLI